MVFRIDNPDPRFVDALDALPGDTDSIAAFLAERGFKGAPGGPNSCPVARYLKDATGDPTAWVGASNAGSDETGFSFSRAHLPQAVKDFTDAFDDGRYLDLIAESSDYE